MSNNEYFTFMVKTFPVSPSEGPSFSSSTGVCATKTGNNDAWLARRQERGHCAESWDKRSSRRAGVCGTAASLLGRRCLFGWHKTIVTSSCGGPCLGEVIPKDTWEIGSISSKAEQRALSCLFCPRKLQTSISHSGLRQLSPGAWHSQNQEPSGGL